MNASHPLSDAFLDELTAELDSEDTIAIALMGSYARGDATEYSDVDVVRFAANPPGSDEQAYRLQYRSGRLVSISTTTVAAKERELSSPVNAVMAVPGLRQARVLLDKDGSLAALREKAIAFTWERLQPAADRLASYDLMGNAEEVHKVLSALVRRDESAAMYGTVGMCNMLTQIVIVQRGLLIQTENSWFHQVYDAVGWDSDWTRYHRLANGFEAGPRHLPPFEARAIAALHLYQETARLLRHVLRPAHAEVVDTAIENVHRLGRLVNW
jgi:predicted nucleotidyltransferase